MNIAPDLKLLGLLAVETTIVYYLMLRELKKVPKDVKVSRSCKLILACSGFYFFMDIMKILTEVLDASLTMRLIVYDTAYVDIYIVLSNMLVFLEEELETAKDRKRSASLKKKEKIILYQAITITVICLLFQILVVIPQNLTELHENPILNIFLSYSPSYLHIILSVIYGIGIIALPVVKIMKKLRKGGKPDRILYSALLFSLVLMGVIFLKPTLAYLGYAYTACILMAPFIYLIFIFLVSRMSTATSDNHKMLLELNVASKIQNEFLPKVFPPFIHHANIDLYAMIKTAKETGGDLYDCFEIDRNHVCFFIADVSEKGIGAALFMMRVKSALHDSAMLHEGTVNIIKNANVMLCENNEESMFATAWLAIVDTDTGIMEFTNAGHNQPYIAHEKNEYHRLDFMHGLALGITADSEYKSNRLMLHDGDSLFLYTDGVNEAHNVKGEYYGYDRLSQVLNRSDDRSPKDVLERVYASVTVYMDDVDQYDDIAMMGVRYTKET